MAQWSQTNGPTGGGTYDLTSAGKYIFVNGGPGGIFRSEDNGLNWKAVNKGLPSYPHCYSFTKSGSSLYASIAGSGVYYSIDFGDNWIAINKGIESLTGYSLFANGNDIYVGSSQGGFYYSTNNGTTWSLIEGILKGKQIRDFVISGNKLFAASDGLYVSEDKGLTWVKLQLGITGVNAITAIDNTIYVSGQEGLQISRDFGATWSTSTIGRSGGAYFMNAIYANGDEVYIGASSGAVFYSADEGKNWSTYLSSTIDNIANSILKNNEFLFLATNEGMYRSADKATTWQAINQGLVNQIIRQTAIDGANILVATDYGLHSSNGNGLSWKKQIIGNKNFGSNPIGAIYVESKYILAGTNGIYKSSDGGNAWNLQLSLGANKYVRALSGSGNKLVALVNGDGIYVSVDNGENWLLKSKSFLENVNFITSYSKGDTVVVASDDNIFISKDLGGNWETRKITPTYFYPTSINFYSSKLIVSTYQGIFESSDFGNLWNKIGDFDLQITFNGLTINPAGIFYAATNKGVYVSYNSGKNWYPLNENLDNSGVFSISINTEFAFCGTYGMGVWKRPLTNLNVRPKIIGLKKDIMVSQNQSITLSVSDFNILDPDNNYPQDFTLKVKSGANYTVSGTNITPILDFNGDLSIQVKVNDGYGDSEEYVAKVKIILGFDEIKSQSFLYPNPVENVLYIGDESNATRIIIYDCFGREVMKRNSSGASLNEYDVSDLKTGIYLVKIEGQNRYQKMIKN
jgi:photosystem II stability/assembly factor-like uncharacterized protein